MVETRKKEGKRLTAARKGIDSTKSYDLDDAISLLKGQSGAKFDETIEVVLNLNVNPAHADQQVRGMVSLPNGVGKDVIVAVFAKGAKAKEAEAAGADIVGDEEFAEKVKSGVVNFDRCIATPEMMPLVGQLGKVLGPKGMMPNPKLGTVTNDIKEAVKAAKGGQIEFRTEKTGIVQAGVGKKSFDNAALSTNIKAFIAAINKAKPSGAKGTYIKSIYVSTSMGPSLKLDISKALAA